MKNNPERKERLPGYSKVYFLTNGLPRFRSNDILIVDRALKNKKSFSKILERAEHQAGAILFLPAGEDTKQIQNFPHLFSLLMEKTKGLSKAKLRLVSLGGGSIGDWTGFAAHILWRGVDCVHIPTTWLAAMDSAHGGKTALNLGSWKNQAGSYHFPTEVYCCRELLLDQPHQRSLDCYGELLKIALLRGGKMWRELNRQALRTPDLRDFPPAFFWKMLPLAVQGKMHFVRRDPFEQKGIRHFLNFGHTIGHLIEGELGIPHGIAIFYGILFDLLWFQKKAILCQPAVNVLPWSPLFHFQQQISDPAPSLQKDKKMQSSTLIAYPTISSLGKPQLLPIALRRIVKRYRIPFSGHSVS